MLGLYKVPGVAESSTLASPAQECPAFEREQLLLSGYDFHTSTLKPKLSKST